MATTNEWGYLEDPPRELVGTAHWVRPVPVDPPAGTAVVASLYSVIPAMDVAGGRSFDYLVVSGQVDQHGAQTLIFGADQDGNPLTADMPGSFDGIVDHVRALERAGYTLAP